MDKQRQITVALAGNPNSGKTTVFNSITGEKARTGNWPGVTVARLEGERTYKGYQFTVVDLPGTYSLTSGTPEEIIARNYILDQKPDVVVNIVDSSNLERNLVLTSELLELQAPLVLDLNMWDEVEAKGYKVDLSLLSKLLAAPVVTTVASRGGNIDALLDAAIDVVEGRTEKRKINVGYGRIIEGYIEKAQSAVESVPGLCNRYPSRWTTVKLLENDAEVHGLLGPSDSGPISKLREVIADSQKGIHAKLGEDPEIAIPDMRYGFAAGIFRETVRLPAEERRSLSDQVDRFAMSRGLGIPIFLVLMWLIFQITFKGGAPLMDLIDRAVGALGHFAGNVLPPGPLNSLIVDGIISGVGGVIIFIPNILILFALISFLEEWGYMARAAFVMDGLMHKIGLHGRSFVPLLMGFGCSVPAILATRTLENKRDRLVTMAIVPLMSCGARLPIYTLLIGAFFREQIAGNMLFLIYIIGVMLAVLMALLFRKTIFRGETTPFVMELPPYRLPTFQGVISIALSRGVHYLRKAGTVILSASVVIWFLSNYPYNPAGDPKWDEEIRQADVTFNSEVKRLNTEYPGIEIPGGIENVLGQINDESAKFKKLSSGLAEASPEYHALEMDYHDTLADIEAVYPSTYKAALAYHLVHEKHNTDLTAIKQHIAQVKLGNSFAGHIGRVIEPAIRPLGFDWRMGIALFTGLAAKEIVVSTMGTIYALGETDQSSGALKEAIRKDPAFNPLVAFTFMIFTLVYSPCLAAIAVQRSEGGSWRWAMFVLVYLTTLAWICSFIVYQTGHTLGVGI